jgi:hypothetical protein
MSTPAEDLESALRVDSTWKEPLLWGVAFGFVIGLGTALIIFVGVIVVEAHL